MDELKEELQGLLIDVIKNNDEDFIQTLIEILDTITDYASSNVKDDIF